MKLYSLVLFYILGIQLFVSGYVLNVSNVINKYAGSL